MSTGASMLGSASLALAIRNIGQASDNVTTAQHLSLNGLPNEVLFIIFKYTHNEYCHRSGCAVLRIATVSQALRQAVRVHMADDMKRAAAKNTPSPHEIRLFGAGDHLTGALGTDPVSHRLELLGRLDQYISKLHNKLAVAELFWRFAQSYMDSLDDTWRADCDKLSRMETKELKELLERQFGAVYAFALAAGEAYRFKVKVPRRKLCACGAKVQKLRDFAEIFGRKYSGCVADKWFTWALETEHVQLWTKLVCNDMYDAENSIDKFAREFAEVRTLRLKAEAVL